MFAVFHRTVGTSMEFRRLAELTAKRGTVSGPISCVVQSLALGIGLEHMDKQQHYTCSGGIDIYLPTMRRSVCSNLD